MVIVARGVAKKITIMFFIFSFLLMHFSAPVKSSLVIEPAKLTITMSEGFPKEAITYYFYATNPYPYDVNASAIIESPYIGQFQEGYTQISNLSWITVKSEKIYIPKNSTGKFEIIIDIPENQKPLQYNKNWEVWVTFSDDGGADLEGGGAVFKVEITARILIHTPSSDKSITVQPSYVVIILIVAILVTFIIIFYSKKSRKN